MRATLRPGPFYNGVAVTIPRGAAFSELGVKAPKYMRSWRFDTHNKRQAR